MPTHVSQAPQHRREDNEHHEPRVAHADEHAVSGLDVADELKDGGAVGGGEDDDDKDDRVQPVALRLRHGGEGACAKGQGKADENVVVLWGTGAGIGGVETGESGREVSDG